VAVILGATLNFNSYQFMALRSCSTARPAAFYFIGVSARASGTVGPMNPLQVHGDFGFRAACSRAYS
jgi:hypothetical protein